MEWSAKWVSFAFDPREDLGVFAFRNRLVLETVPDVLMVRASADNRYKLYVNGQMVAFGPQRGDERHWFYETLDLAPFLEPGGNWIVALVWNFGRWAPMAQHSARTGFVVDSHVEALRTPADWEVARLEGWDFDMMHRGVGEFYIDVGPGEILRSGPSATVDGVVGEPGKKLTWTKPHVICQAEERGACTGGTPWMLIPRSIPLMRYRQRNEPPLVRNRSNQPFSSATLGDGEFLLLDYVELLCAYPRVFVSCEGRAVVTLTYDEALWSERGKGHRNEVEGKESRGYQDCIELDAWSLEFEPLWWRTYRYLRIEVSGDPVSIKQVNAIETGYPLQVESSFEADDPSVKPIWDVSVRTAERCAGETYFDCPYYEQLQYVGDTRIQALIGYYLGRDRALQRNAVETLGWSLMENGLTQSRCPSRQTQVIPPFSLWWVMMLYDQMLYDSDEGRPDFVSPQTLSRVLGRYRKLSRTDSQFWQFADWVPEWPAGVPPRGAKSSVHRLTLAHATAAAASLKSHLEGKPHLPVKPTRWTDFVPEGLGQYGSADGRDCLVRSGVDEPASEHAEALYRLLCDPSEFGQAQDASDVLESLMAWPGEALAAANAAKCTFYFSYYKHLAMFGQPEPPTNPNQPEPIFDYMQELAPWKQMIEDGLTTFAETPEPTRSDCHAWSAHPILGFFQIVAGVTSIAPGWKKVRIMPHPGSLKRFDARIAHPDGELRVAYENDAFLIDTPIPAEFVWSDKRRVFEPGKHRIG